MRSASLDSHLLSDVFQLLLLLLALVFVFVFVLVVVVVVAVAVAVAIAVIFKRRRRPLVQHFGFKNFKMPCRPRG